MMLQGGDIGSLELREEQGGARRFRGRFPYNTPAVISNGGRNGGRPRKEVIRPGAFRFAIEDPDRNILFQYGHEVSKPMASKRAGTLTFEDADDALYFDALLTPDIQQSSWVRDFLAGYAAGLITGISPGFMVPPKSVAPNAVEVVEEDPAEGRALINYINDMILLEFSAVTRPAYPEAQVEARDWNPTHTCTPSATQKMLKGWLL